ncbi:hypothetical protein CY35_04G149300 [Sphagnum magellanicum]|nr:hypothetical protein CY35_04G149300 [Sphagnum magellanicum]
MNTPAIFKCQNAGTCIQYSHKGDRVWLHPFFTLHFLIEFQCLLSLPTFHMPQNHCIPGDHIVSGHSVEHFLSILQAPAFCIHVNKATDNKHIRLTVALYDLFMSKPTFFKCHDTGTCIQDPHKGDRVRLHPFTLHSFI